MYASSVLLVLSGFAIPRAAITDRIVIIEQGAISLVIFAVISSLILTGLYQFELLLLCSLTEAILFI